MKVNQNSSKEIFGREILGSFELLLGQWVEHNFQPAYGILFGKLIVMQFCSKAWEWFDSETRSFIRTLRKQTSFPFGRETFVNRCCFYGLLGVLTSPQLLFLNRSTTCFSLRGKNFISKKLFYYCRHCGEINDYATLITHFLFKIQINLRMFPYTS